MFGPQTATALRQAPVTSADGLRIALFSGNYNYTRDGANKALNRLVGHLIERGATVRVYSPTSRRPAFPPTGDLVSVPSLAIPGRSEFRVALGLPRSTAADVRAFAPNLVHVSAPDWLGTSAQRLARTMGVPIVASMHTRFETYFEYYGLRRLHDWASDRQRQFYCASDHVLAPNDASRHHLQAMGVPLDKIGIWSRGVEHDLFNPARRDFAWRRDLGFADEDVIILFFGRIVREKGTAQFVGIIRELRRRGIAARPLIVGDGPARGEMEAQLGEAVFLGHLDGANLGRAVASADILLNPSTTEAFGNVNLEAMAAGVCVISVDVGSASALMTDDVDGFLVDGNPAAFADKVLKLARDPATRDRIGRQATATARNYRWTDVLDDVVHTYRDLASR